jgi:hypothetical protein
MNFLDVKISEFSDDCVSLNYNVRIYRKFRVAVLHSRVRFQDPCRCVGTAPSRWYRVRVGPACLPPSPPGDRRTLTRGSILSCPPPARPLAPSHPPPSPARP